jgi:hypothetical protein
MERVCCSQSTRSFPSKQQGLTRPQFCTRALTRCIQRTIIVLVQAANPNLDYDDEFRRRVQKQTAVLARLPGIKHQSEGLVPMHQASFRAGPEMQNGLRFGVVLADPFGGGFAPEPSLKELSDQRLLLLPDD